MTTTKVLVLPAIALLALYCSVSPAQSGAMCVADDQCSDDQFCNGVERCAPGDPAADGRGCRVAQAPACSAEQSCREATDRCETKVSTQRDSDGDGVESVFAGGADCDDADDNRYPGNAEVADFNGHDEDCDPRTYAPAVGSNGRPTGGDWDGDGFVSSRFYNTSDDGLRFSGEDCDDFNRDIHPTEAEVCNGIDDNCDGQVDEGLPQLTMYPDADGDGFGKAGTAPIRECSPAAGQVANANDCDDANPAIFPGASACNGKGGVSYCAPNGEMKAGACESGAFCMSQPSGSGVCVPMKPAPQSLK